MQPGILNQSPWHDNHRFGVICKKPEVKTEVGYSADICPHNIRDICLARDICIFQGGQTHIQSKLLQEIGAKKGCGRRGGAGGGGGNPKGMPLWLPPTIT